MNLIPGIQMISSGLQAEKIRLECITQNIVNAQTTKGPDGKPYQKHEVVFESFLDKSQNSNNLQSVRVAKIKKSDIPGEKIYKPGHPHADDKGMVLYPNVKVHQEMVDMISSTRAFEANLTVANAGESLVRKTLAVGRLR